MVSKCNDQYPNPGEHVDRHFRQQFHFLWDLFIGARDLIGIWLLGRWDLSEATVTHPGNRKKKGFLLKSGPAGVKILPSTFSIWASCAHLADDLHVAGLTIACIRTGGSMVTRFLRRGRQCIYISAAALAVVAAIGGDGKAET